MGVDYYKVLQVDRGAKDKSSLQEILTIEIKPGWKKITFTEKGNEQPNVIPSDIVFVVDEKPHATFIREGNELIVMQKISLAEALTGHTVHLTTLDGRSLTIPIHNNNDINVIRRSRSLRRHHGIKGTFEKRQSPDIVNVILGWDEETSCFMNYFLVIL